jgi:phage terminase small subunit
MVWPRHPVQNHAQSFLHSEGHATWGQVRERLEEQQLVHPGDKLHVRGKLVWVL